MDVLEGHYDPKTEYQTQKNGLPLAFGIYKSGGAMPDDISMYGELRANYLTWDATSGATL